MEQIIRIGMDGSKSLFQLHGVNASEQPILRKMAVAEGDDKVLRKDATNHRRA